MLFHWIWVALKWLVKLVVPPPKRAEQATIDWKQPCPACGFLGSVTVEHIVVTSKPGSVDAVRKGLMLFKCAHCQAWWHTEPLYLRTQTGGRPIGPDEIGGREVKGLTK